MSYSLLDWVEIWQFFIPRRLENASLWSVPPIWGHIATQFCNFENHIFQKVRPILKTLSQDLSHGTLTTKFFLNLQFDIRQFHEKFATVSHLSFLSQVHLSKGRGHNVTGKAKSLIVTAINITHQFVGLSIVPLKIKGKSLAVP